MTLAYILFTLSLSAQLTATQAFPRLLPRNSTDNPRAKCSDDEINAYSYVNATTSLTIPGFRSTPDSPRNWIVNFGLKDNRNHTQNWYNDNYLTWIDSTAADDDLQSVELPYRGCLVSFVMREVRKSTGDIGQGDGCAGVFSDGCYNALVQGIRSAAESQTASEGNRTRTVPDTCLDLVTEANQACDEGELWASKSTDAVFGNGTNACSEPGVAEGSKFRAVSRGVTVGGSADMNNYTRYENYATYARPFVMIGWSKNEADTWGDARLICPTTNQIEPGSRQVSAAPILGAPSANIYTLVVLGSLVIFSIM